MEQLGHQHRLLLDTIYGVLLKEERWPSYIYLERVLAGQHDIELQELRETLPEYLTSMPPARYPVSDQQEVQLTVDGLLRCTDTGEDAPLFFRIFREFVELDRKLVPTSMDSIPNPCLTSEELSVAWVLPAST